MPIIRKDLLKSIAKSSASHELADKIGETALDIVLDDGVLKDIPIIGTAISLYKAGDKVKAYLFAKKVLTFLNEIEKIKSEERIRFIEKNFGSKEKEEELSDTLLMYVESASRLVSCKLLGRAFFLYASSKINKRYYELFCIASMRMNDYLIQQMEQYYRNETKGGVEFHAMHDLATLGLLDIRVAGLYSESSGDLLTLPRKNELGKWFFQLMLLPDIA